MARPPKPKNKPMKRPDTGAAPPNLRRRRVRIATISPESTLEAQHVELKQPSPAQKRRARRKARKLNRRSNAWAFASPDVGTKVDPQTVTPSPDSCEGTPNRRSQRAPRSAPYSNSGRHDGGLVLTSLTPGSDERLKRTLRRTTTPHQLPLINDATPIINDTRASPEERARLVEAARKRILAMTETFSTQVREREDEEERRRRKEKEYEHKGPEWRALEAEKFVVATGQGQSAVIRVQVETTAKRRDPGDDIWDNTDDFVWKDVLEKAENEDDMSSGFVVDEKGVLSLM